MIALKIAWHLGHLSLNDFIRNDLVSWMIMNNIKRANCEWLNSKAAQKRLKLVNTDKSKLYEDEYSVHFIIISTRMWEGPNKFASTVDNTTRTLWKIYQNSLNQWSL